MEKTWNISISNDNADYGIDATEATINEYADYIGDYIIEHYKNGSLTVSVDINNINGYDFDCECDCDCECKEEYLDLSAKAWSDFCS